MKQNTKKRLIMFSIITLLFLLIMSVLYAQTHSGVFLTLCMFTPAASVILTRLLTGEGAKDMFLSPHVRGNVRWYLAAWFLPPLIACIGTVLYFLIFPDDFLPLASIYAAETKANTSGVYFSSLLQLIPLAILINPLMGLIQCLGEEFAWRAYLLPKLKEYFSPVTAVLLTGIVWGVWHAPFIAMGYNYGPEHPVLGIAAMILLCTILGSIEGFLFLRTGSVWTSAIFHAALNGIDLWAPSALFTDGNINTFIGPDLTGIIGGSGFIVAAAVCLPAIKRTADLQTSCR